MGIASNPKIQNTIVAILEKYPVSYPGSV